MRTGTDIVNPCILVLKKMKTIIRKCLLKNVKKLKKRSIYIKMITKNNKTRSLNIFT